MPLDLAITLANLDDKMGDLLGLLHAGARRGAVPAEAMLDLCTVLRRLAIGSFLLDLDGDGFVGYLYRSAGCYATLLERGDRGDERHRYYTCLGRATPLLDAIAIGDEASIDSIHRVAPDDWRPEYEEEDDYRFYRMLLRFLHPGSGLEEELAAFRTSLRGVASWRYEACSALANDDAETYWKVVYDYLEEVAALEADKLRTSTAEPEYAATESHMSIEGLALIRIGLRRGYTLTDPEFPLVPADVLSADLVRYPQTDPWPELRSRLFGGAG